MTRRDPLARELPPWLSSALIAAAFGIALLMEARRPLRAVARDKRRRDARNLAMAALAGAALSAFEKPVVQPLARLVHARRWGLLRRLALPAWAEVALALALLDYTLYLWHVLTHKTPLLARFHRVHHADAEMDASTALRFHFGEMILSVPWRAAQVALIGAGPLSLSVWQTATLAAILFHHSNWRLPAPVERRLCRLIVTPRMHGIHHSIVQDETDANWSTIFSWPDYLHGTARLNVPQELVVIGLPRPRDEAELGLGRLLVMPAAGGPPEAQRPPELATRPARPDSGRLALEA